MRKLIKWIALFEWVCFVARVHLCISLLRLLRYPQSTQLSYHSLCNIGSIQNRRKRFDDAIATFKEALDLQRGVMGHDHPRVVATLDNIAYSYSKTRDYPAALTCYKKMLRAQVSHCGTFSDECFDTFRKQVLMYEKLKLFSEAVDEIKETLRLQKSMLSKNSEIIARTKEMREEITEKLKRSKSSPVAV